MDFEIENGYTKADMFEALGRTIYRWRWAVLGLAMAVVAVAAVYGTAVFGKLGSGGFEGTQFESYQAGQEISDHFGGDESLLVLFTAHNGWRVADPRFEAAVAKTLGVLKGDSAVDSVADIYTSSAPQLVSHDQHSTYAVVGLKGDQAAAMNAVKRLRPKLASDVLEVQTGGAPAINLDFNSQIAKDLAKAETISFILLAVLLVIVFRGLVAAALPLALGAFGVLGAFLVVRLLTNVTSVSQYAINVIILLGLGLSIDYSLFMVNRFREELRQGGETRMALLTTMRTAGRTVLFSGLTVILSLLGLLIFPIGFLRSMGMGGSAAVAVAVIGALTVLPALLAVLELRVDAWSFGRTRADYRALTSGRHPQQRPAHTWWYRMAQGAMRRPLVTIALIVFALAFVGQYFMRAEFSSADYRSLPDGTASKAVSVALANDFSGGSNSPIDVVIQAPLTAQKTAAEVADYMVRLHQLPGVKNVTMRPSRDKKWVLLELSYNSAYDQKLARDLVTAVRNQPHPGGWNLKVGGQTAELVDLLHAIGHYALYAALVVVVALVLLLFIMLRSLVVPLQALFMNVLSLSATFGALVWVFQEGHLAKWLGFTSVGSVDATQPVLIFGIAFGLSMDYSVFLLSRIKEQYDQSYDMRDAIAQGVQKTGPIITAAATLFIVVVAAFATSPIPIIKQIGIGLGLAVFIDAFLVRTMLVPAIMVIFGRANWWPGHRQQRLAKRG